MKKLRPLFLMAALAFTCCSALAQKMNGMNPGETVADAAVPQNNAMTPVKDV